MALSATAVGRINKLISVMESLPSDAAKHFNMIDWYTHTGRKHKLLEGDVLDASDLKTCGTSACAIGWASTDPYFRKLGMRLEVCNGYPVIVTPEENTFENDPWAELSRFFDLDRDFVWFLFGSESLDETPKAWARRARHCLKLWTKK